MQPLGRLDRLLSNTAASDPHRTALEDPDRGSVTYSTLLNAANSLTSVLRQAGVVAGDRVGLLAPKSIDGVTAIFGILGADAAYVPVDAGSPLTRAAYIFENCAVAACIVEPALCAGLIEAMPTAAIDVLGAIDLPGIAGRDLVVLRVRHRTAGVVAAESKDLAYILYTSGSTGTPKGVMHTHASALSFIDWCSEEFVPTHDDRFSSHAPFHFDLSILDLFVAIKHGATLVLIGEERGKQPQQLAALISEKRLTVWYSTPSILRLLIEYGKLERWDCSALRLVIYAGEVFPPKHQRRLRGLWPHPRYYNLYGPTETNVCTYDVVNVIPADDQASPLPIGRACSGDRLRVADADGSALPIGTEGELLVQGGSVMTAYWNLPEQNARAFHVDADGSRWYRTGDIVVDDGTGCYLFIGRRDRMVKRRGYRVELGEIEAAMLRHANISEAAAIAIADPDSGVLIKVFIAWTLPDRPSLIDLKVFSASVLPTYMVPDRIVVLAELPKTSTDKIDYQRLKDAP